jgi:hypothetical protein
MLVYLFGLLFVSLNQNYYVIWFKNLLHVFTCYAGNHLKVVKILSWKKSSSQINKSTLQPKELRKNNKLNPRLAEGKK